MTAAFIPQTPDTMSEVRYYTPFDPYFYTVDNRPLADLAANITAVAEQGSDSARRAVAITQLGLGSLAASLLPQSWQGQVCEGFPVSLVGTGLTIGPGAIYQASVVNDSTSYSMVKQGLSPQPYTFAATSPDTALGNAKNYLVQVRYRALDASAMTTSQVPYVDQANPLLPCLLLHGDAILSIKEGATGTLGSQVTPSADAGWTPLYVVTVCTTTSSNSVVAHPSAPVFRGSKSTTALYSNNVLPGATSSVQLNPSASLDNANPFKPLKIRLSLSSSAGSGGCAIHVSVAFLANGGTVSPTATSWTETLPMPSSANTLTVVELSTSVPATVFSGFTSGTWGVLPGVARVTITRDYSSSGNTNSGDVTVYEVKVSQ